MVTGSLGGSNGRFITQAPFYLAGFAIYITLACMNTALTMFLSLLTGGIAGVFYGFAAAGHRASLSGYSAPNSRPLLQLFTEQNPSLTLGKAVFFLASIALSLVVFFGALLMPAFLSSRFVPESEFAQILSYVALFAGAGLGGRFGTHLWHVYS